MYRIQLPIESGNTRVLKKLIRKPHTVEHARRIVGICRELEIQTISIFVIGMLGETREELRGTVQFAKGIDSNYTMFHIATPISGSALEKQVLTKELTDKDSIHGKYPRDNVYFETEFLKNAAKKDYYVESDTRNPINMYGFTKHGGDCFISEIAENYYIFRIINTLW